MPLTADQIEKMDAALGGVSAGLSSERMAEMDAALGISAQPQSQQGDAGGAPRAAVYGFSGGSIPFGNVISSGIGAGIAKAASPFTGEERTIGELYEQAQADTKATQEAHPGATLSGNIAGIVSTMPLAATKGAQAVGRFLGSGKVAKDAGLLAKTGSLALRSGKGAVVAAPVTALYAAGEADPGQRLEAAKSGAIMGAAMGGALPVAGAALGAAGQGAKSVYKGFKARDIEALNQAGQAIKDRSSAAYKIMRESGATFKPGATNKIIQNMQTQLIDDGILNPRLHKKTIDLFEDFKQEALDQNITLEGLDHWRQLFGQVAGEFGDKVNARKAAILKDSLDDAVNSLSDDAFAAGDSTALNALKTARQEWARQSKFNQIKDIVEGASGDANKLKRDLEKFRLNKKKIRGWSNDELAALEFAAKQTTGEGALKMLGKFGFDLGSGRAVGNTALPVLGSIASGVGTASFAPAVAVPAIGTAARVGQKMVARGKAEDLLKVIEGGGELSMKAINALPEKEKTKVLNYILTMNPAKAAVITNNQKVK